MQSMLLYFHPEGIVQRSLFVALFHALPTFPNYSIYFLFPFESSAFTGALIFLFCFYNLF
jgi:hypothetical protein